MSSGAIFFLSLSLMRDEPFDLTIPTVSSFFFLSFIVLLSNAGVGLGVDLGMSPFVCFMCCLSFLFGHIIPVIAILSSMKIVLEIRLQGAYRRGFTK
jgi:hypothetical protein